ncbi:protein transporter Sec31 [Streptomyces sp. CB02130]|uniref:protein transporter Sec31 n=1 Tax=Streptomyces sp. CB02130 TaxID=1703934 RepID=UPI00094066FF|nr:protein transporter Sec31 [Streptomyces sp. CB02130]OKJ24332.1 protein transporter Sec31 [Streptomyces sp. CB02130]
MKTRTVERTRLVPHTIDGRTEMVLDRYTVDVPRPPRDWDRIVLTGVTAAAASIGVASIVWSTASIGDLLARSVPEPAAYAAAAVFDLVWLSCMALEWLARYDQARAALPRRAGYVALAVAMAAVGAHGWISGEIAIGFIGAAVSGLAKAMWTVVLRHHAKPLDPLTQQWVDKQRAEAGGRLAMVAVRRELTRAEQAVTAEHAALSGASPDADPERPESRADRPDDEETPAVTGPMTIADAVRTALSSGITDPDAVLRYVRTVADANAKEASVERYIRSLRTPA